MPDMSPEISIVIPAYNASRYIRDSISSVLDQTFSSWELIVVDDGSTDNTAEIIKGFLTDPRIKLLQQKNRGVSAARNAGIQEAKGRYIAFLDADDFYLKTNLQYKFDILNANTAIDFIYSDLIRTDKDLNEVAIETGVNVEHLFEEVLSWQRETIPCLPSNVVVKSSALKGELLFDENLSNCADRYMKIMLAKHLKGYHIPEPLLKYRDTPGSMSKNVSLLEHDEKYIAKKIVKDNILPPGKFRRSSISNMYFIVSGSWYKDAHKPMRAMKFALKAILIYPPSLMRLLKKIFALSE